MLPLASDRLKRTVTPASVTNSADGNPPRTASTGRPPYAPTAHASGIASSPTLMRDVQLMTIAITRATTEAVAGDGMVSIADCRLQIAD